MKFLPLIWSGIWRRPGRAVLIFLQVCVAFALFGVLQGLKTGVEQVIAETRADLLLVHGSIGLADSLPLSQLEQIKSVPGVKVVAPVELSGAIYQNPDQKMVLVAILPVDGWLSAFTFTIAPDVLKAFETIRTAAIIKESLAKKYGWKVGDHIPLKSATAQINGSTDWTFDVVGTFTDSDVGAAGDALLINYAYFDEARLAGKGTVAHFNVTVSDPTLAVAVSDEIDRRFANSSNETRTESLRELVQSEMQSIGDLDFLIRTILSAVLVALLFATATMMMQSTRERASEFAVLKTLGFTDSAVSLVIIAEAVAVFVAAAACGMALARLVFPFASKFVPGLSMPKIIVAAGLACAALAALISASIPAIAAARSNIAAALARL
jgi:putative ABC transport system permease protein